MQTMLFYTPEDDISPLPAGIYGKLMKHFTERHHEANAGQSGVEPLSVRALGELFNARSRKKLAAEK